MVGNKNKHIWKYYMMLSLFGCAAFFVFTFSLAVPAKAVTISQLNLEFNARPGDTIEQTVQLYDDILEGATIYPAAYNFTESPDHEGSVLILTDPADLKPDHLWIKYGHISGTDEVDDDATGETAEEEVDQDTEQVSNLSSVKFELPADGSLVDFPYRIEIPKDAEPGTHLISLVFQTRPVVPEGGSEGTSIYIGTNVATNIFLKVLGNTIDDIDVNFQSGVYTNKDPNLSPAERSQYFKPNSFFLKPPVDFKVTVDNLGNTHQKPDGNIKIVNDLFGAQPEQILVNPENKIILPGTDRTFEVSSFGQGFMFGKYRAKILLLYGLPLRPIEKEISFWIVPLVEILIVLGAILLLIIIIIVIRKLRKKGRAKKELEREERLRQQIIEELKGKKVIPDGKEQKKGRKQEAQNEWKKVKKGKNKGSKKSQ